MAKKIKFVFCLAAVVSFGVVIFQQVSTSAQTKTVDFRRDIEPIFAANCYQCHSAKKVSAQLRLDLKTTAMKGGVNGVVIVPGNSKESRLVHRILGEGGEKRMPLIGDPLKPEQIELIRKWIDEGADWPDSQLATQNAGLPRHWAFVAPIRPAIPAVKNKTWVRTPIDNFILTELEKQKMTPSPEAAKTTLIRRLSLDLTGLPPTIKEIDRFIADKSPRAYERLIDRLLASPHYGERWARWWLDAARYADTNGFEKDLPRSIWPYRDWVIKAFKSDMPFDQFTIEQLAGDLLPNPSNLALDQIVATGFLRNSMRNEEGGVDPEQFRVEGLIDRVDTIGKAFLGLTINCAQCHTHKFDPIKHEEYYRFYAFLNSDDEPEIEVPEPKVSKQRAEINQKIEKIEKELIEQNPDCQKRQAEWEEKSKQGVGNWTVLEDTSIFASFGTKFDHLPDHSLIAKGDNSTKNVYVVKAKTSEKKITAFRLELLTDTILPRGGPGRSPTGSLYLSEFIVEAGPADKPEAQQRVAFAGATADISRVVFPIKNAIDGDTSTAWDIEAGPVLRNQDRKAVFVLKQPISFEHGASLTIHLSQKQVDAVNIGRFRLSVTSDPDPRADPLPAKVRRILAIHADKRTPEQQREVFSFYRTTVKEWSPANEKIEDLLKDWPAGATTLALSQRSVLRETHLFRRGDWKRPGEVVTPGTPSFLNPFPKDAPRNRLGLAQWIVDRNNPLTARVIVNRVWQQYFGVGLVTTPEDFGMRCEKPSHPELLDWLAREFIESGWSFKKLHQLIVNSAVYRQSSKVTPKLEQADPTNRWLARLPRLRVEAEGIRDIALTASGLLSRKIGGPPVFPPIPDGVLNLSYGSPMKWETATGEDRYRRGLYTFWKRSIPFPSMLAFDAPTADSACTRRIRSNTPLQALTTLNDQSFMEAAQALALRVWKEGGRDDRSKMIYAFRLCTGRAPDAFELQHLMKLLNQQRPYFRGQSSETIYVAAPDLNNIPANVDLQQVAPWTMVARVLLNMDETITRE